MTMRSAQQYNSSLTCLLTCWKLVLRVLLLVILVGGGGLWPRSSGPREIDMAGHWEEECGW